ncbi:hypothetical protein JQ617_08210 [Bradyrhizobium sp. KB893862 SZCCT0404]|uniref:hypothetical protein n=1 Tax=Bradyrhizobium sp. KB893862 SZCCT0404 TaxID=2807672 RepID=UPI001BA81DAC|nr:hypothetical protein [Bradyrhizobium sp. KB893862 SZCCT0404]MBR1173933.1 hypothetical protein [Bradyrhizobium sp. KB893862 SZCCT0404]
MPNTHLRSLLSQAREFVSRLGRIPCDHAVRMMAAGMDVNLIEENLRKEYGH